MNAAQPISVSVLHNGCAARAMIPFGAVFLLLGLAGLWFTVINPVWSLLRARSWPTADARVLSSSVKVNHDSDGSTNRPLIRYEYQVDGKKLESDRYSFSVWSIGSRDWADRIVDRYAVGTVHPCYYDPARPSEALLDRSFNWPYLVGLFTLAFVAVGAGLLWHGVRETRKAAAGSSGLAAGSLADSGLAGAEPGSLATGSSGVAASNRVFNAGRGRSEGHQVLASNDARPWLTWEGPRKLQPDSSRTVRVIFLFIFSGFWNTVVGFGLLQNLDGKWSFIDLFMLPFVVIGVATAIIFLHQLLAWFNPIIVIALENAAVPLGDELVVAWECEGRARRIRELVIEVTGTESATYTRGTDTVTATHVFCKLPLARASGETAIRFGSATVAIPAGTAPSFAANRNRIEWAIEIRGRIAWWPDIAERYVFFVRPLRTGEAG